MIERVEHPRGVVELVLDRPARRNALSFAMLDALREHCTDLAARESVCAVVLSARGPVFAAGGDLHEIEALLAEDDGAQQLLDRGHAALKALSGLPMPCVAALDGPALGGGAELALAADVRVVSPRGSLTLRQSAMGLCSAWGTAERLRELLGYAAAAELLLFDETWDAEALARRGLARRTDGSAREHALQLAARLSELPTSAVRANKRLLRQGSGRGDEVRAFTALFGAAAHREALAAFKARSAR